MAVRPKIGVAITDLRMPGREAIQQAARIGYQTIVVDTVATEFEPRQFGQSARRDLGRLVRQVSMELAALQVDIGGDRFGDSHRLDEAVDRTRWTLQMAADMNVPVVVVEPGYFTPEASQLVEAVRLLAQAADRTGRVLAIRTGYSDPHHLRDLLAAAGAWSCKACYDPAGLMLSGFAALAGIEPLADQIALAYLRDAAAGPKGSGGGGQETVLGQGQLDLAEYVAALHEASYQGPLIVRRIHAMDPLAELTTSWERAAGLAR